VTYVTLAPAPNTEQLHFYATASYPCSYLPGRLARSQVLAPPQAVSTRVYSGLVDIGFRRSGTCVTKMAAMPAAAWTRTASSNIRSSCCKAGSIRAWWSSAPPGRGRPGRRPEDGLHRRRAAKMASRRSTPSTSRSRASYGTYGVLWQIQQARAMGLPHLYLGYWIAERQDELQGALPSDAGPGQRVGSRRHQRNAPASTRSDGHEKDGFSPGARLRYR
jgi:hypothetical protein